MATPAEIKQRQQMAPLDRAKPFTRALEFDKSKINEADRTVELSFSSENPVSRYDWWTDAEWQEILDHTAGSIDLSRLETVGAFLWMHDGRSIPIGAIQTVWLDESEHMGRAIVKFDTDPVADLIYQKVISGSIRGVSVGYTVQVWEEVKAGAKSTDGRFAGPCWIARKWEPHEFSAVALPADDSVGFARDLSCNIAPIPVIEQVQSSAAGREIGSMEVDQKMKIGLKRVNESAPAATPQNIDDVKAARSEATKRAAEIVALCQRHGVENATELIASEMTLDEIRAEILENLAREQQPTPVAPVTSVVDEMDKIRAAATDAILMRSNSGVKIANPVSGAAEMRGMTLMDLAREVVERRGIRVFNKYDKTELVRAALGTDDFPYILGATSRRALLNAYENAGTTYQLWCSIGSLSDFKSKDLLRFSEAPDFKEVKADGEYESGKFSESNASIKLKTYGIKTSFTRQSIINDDLDALVRIPAAFAASARRKINELVYGISLLSTANMSDGSPLFHADHKNLAAAGAAPSVATLGAGRAAMKKHKDIGGKQSLNIAPSYIIVPTDLETTADQLISSVVDPAKSNATPNPFGNKLAVVADAILDTDTAAWFLVASGAMVDTVQVAFLDGQDQPVYEQMPDPDVDGVIMRVRIDVGTSLIDYRGFYKNPGK